MRRLATSGLGILFLWFAPFSACAQGTITTVAGSGTVFHGDGGPATNASLVLPQGLAVDSAGNVFATDTFNHLVIKISPSGVLNVVAGNGIPGFSGDGGPATSASLNQPASLTLDAAGNLYVADALNHRIRKVTPAGIITTVAGNGSAGFSGDGGPATSTSLNNPSGVAVDSASSLYIADTNNQRIRKVGPGATITTVAGNGVDGFSGDGGPATSASLSRPGSVAPDISGNLYIADTHNHIVRKVNAGGTITTVAGNGNKGYSGDGGPATSASLSDVFGLAVHGAGNIYIADAENHAVRKFVPAGTITTIAGNGAPGFSGDGGPAVSAALAFPFGVVVDVGGNLYIADTVNSRIRKVNASGTIATMAGGGLAVFSGDGGPASSALLALPLAVAVDSSGNVYIADSFGARVRRVSPSGTITAVAGTGTPGFSGDSGPATVASLGVPGGLALDPVGNLYIADDLLNRVRKVSPAGIITTVAGNGSSDPFLDGVRATSVSLRGPSGMAVDSAGNLYIADVFHHRIRKVSAGIITTVAGNGQKGFSGDGGPATNASLNSPTGVAVDAASNIYITDRQNDRVRKVNPSGTISTMAGNGVRGFSGDSGPATNASLNQPSGVAVDSASNLYIADVGNGRIRKVSAGGVISTVAGSGIQGFSGDGGPAMSAVLSLPVSLLGGVFDNPPGGLALDTAGNLYIADGGNNRIRAVLARAPSFSVAPATLTFSGAAGGPPVPPQLVGVSSLVAGLAWTAQTSTQSGGNWLSISPTAGSTPGSISASVSAGNLSPGTYQGTITVTAPLASPPTQTVSVQLTVTAALPTQLSVDRTSLTFQISLGAGNPPAQVVRVGNAGSGTLNWTAQASTQNGGGWLVLAPGSGSAAAGSPSTVQVAANVAGLGLGVYSGSVQVSSSTTNETKTVSVTLLVSQVAQTILVSQSGLLFTGVEGGSMVPSQTIGILNTGQGTMNWTVSTSTLSGGGWLSVTPSSGSSVANSLQVPLVEVGASVSGLQAGQYNGLVRVDALGANNSPQFVTVVLNVLPLGSNPGVLVRPTGLIFAARAGTSSPGSQTVRLSTAGAGTANAVGGLLTAAGGNWLEAVPRNLVLAATDPRTIVMQPTLGTLAAGVYRGALTLIFDDGSPSQVVDVLFLVVAPSASAAGHKGVAAEGTCSPQKLLAVYRSGSKLAAQIGLPSTIEVQVVDDCGNGVPDATVVASFSNNDPPLTLASLRNGTYTGTWRPLFAAAQVAIKVRAELPPLAPFEVQAPALSVQENAKAALLFSAGVVDAASFSSGAPLAPGSIIAVFGRNLAASSDSAQSVPLPTNLSGATLSVGNVNLPLFFASNGQINAQLPFELAPNSQPQVVLQTQVQGLGQLLAVPETITVTAARPAIFTTDPSGTRQGAIVNLQGQTVDSAAPATAGDVVLVFATGMGATDPKVPSGQAGPSTPLAKVVLPVEVRVGGQRANVPFAGLAPFFVGLYQLNVEIPAGVTPDPAVPLVVIENGVTSNAVTLAVR